MWGDKSNLPQGREPDSAGHQGTHTWRNFPPNRNPSAKNVSSFPQTVGKLHTHNKGCQSLVRATIAMLHSPPFHWYVLATATLVCQQYYTCGCIVFTKHRLHQTQTAVLARSVCVNVLHEELGTQVLTGCMSGLFKPHTLLSLNITFHEAQTIVFEANTCTDEAYCGGHYTFTNITLKQFLVFIQVKTRLKTQLNLLAYFVCSLRPKGQ